MSYKLNEIITVKKHELEQYEMILNCVNSNLIKLDQSIPNIDSDMMNEDALKKILSLHRLNGNVFINIDDTFDIEPLEDNVMVSVNYLLHYDEELFNTLEARNYSVSDIVNILFYLNYPISFKFSEKNILPLMLSDSFKIYNSIIRTEPNNVKISLSFEIMLQFSKLETN